jgi:hypothetical protein
MVLRHGSCITLNNCNIMRKALANLFCIPLIKDLPEDIIHALSGYKRMEITIADEYS